VIANWHSLSGVHARSCTTDNDDCRNTRLFRNVGQNIGYDYYGEKSHNVTAVIKRILDDWYNEHKRGNRADLRLLTPGTVQEMGRFTMMVNDKSSDLGCAMVRFWREEQFHVYFTCNYGSTNFLDRHVYETGTPPCSGCLTGCNHMWMALCSDNEKIDPNHLRVGN